jgi:hypothetical protein
MKLRATFRCLSCHSESAFPILGDGRIGSCLFFNLLAHDSCRRCSSVNIQLVVKCVSNQTARQAEKNSRQLEKELRAAGGR